MAPVNIIGCLMIAILLTIVEARPSLPEAARLLLVTGLLGSLTMQRLFVLLPTLPQAQAQRRGLTERRRSSFGERANCPTTNGPWLFIVGHCR